jgi:hypothetical protein
MDRADNAAQSAKESVQEVHIFLFNLMFYIFLENSFSPQWHNGLCIRFKNDNKPKTKGKKECWVKFATLEVLIISCIFWHRYS